MAKFKKLLIPLIFLVCALALTLIVSATTYGDDTMAKIHGSVARIGAEGEGDYYTSLSAAVTAASAGDTIVVFADTTTGTITLTKNDLTFTGTATVTSSSRMFTVNSDAVTEVTFAGDLTLQAESNSILRAVSGADEITVNVAGASLLAPTNTSLWFGNSTTAATVNLTAGKLVGGGYYGIYFGADQAQVNTNGDFTEFEHGTFELNMTGGTIEGKLDSVRTDSATTTLNLNGGKILAHQGSTSGAIRVTTAATQDGEAVAINLDGTEISGDVNAMYLEAPITLTVDSGLVEANTYCVRTSAAATITINGGAIRSLKNNMLYLAGGAQTVTLNGGELHSEAATGLYMPASATGSTLTVNGGKITAANAAISWRNDLTLTVNAGLICSSSYALYAGGADSVINVRGGELISGSNAIINLHADDITCNISGGVLSPERGNLSVNGIYASSTGAGCAVNVRGGAIHATGAGAPFCNNSEDATFNFYGGFTTAGGAMVFHDQIDESNNIAYPAGKTIYANKALYLERGAQVRIVTGTNGIRFLSYMKADAVAYLADLGADMESLSFGTIILPFDEAKELQVLTLEQMQAHGVQYKVIPADQGLYYDAAAGYTVRAALVNLQEKNVLRTFTAVSYVTYTIDDVTYTQYSAWAANDHARTITQVARAALQNGGYSGVDQEAVLEGFAYYQTTTVSGYDITDYEIVVPDFNSYFEYYIALTLAERLKLCCGEDVAIVDAENTTGKKQIRVGTSLCSAATPTADGYAIKMNGTALEIAAGSYLGYTAALDTLLNNVFSYRQRTVAVSSSLNLSGVDASDAATVARDHSNLRLMFNNVYGGTAFDNDSSYNTAQRMSIAAAVYQMYLPDVLGLQEYHDSQRTVLDPLLTDMGYEEVPIESYSIAPSSTYSPNTRANSLVMATSQNSTPLYYNSDVLTLRDYGYFWYADINYAHSIYATILGEDYTAEGIRGITATDYSKGVTWAVFTHNETGRNFLVASTHFWWQSEDIDDVCREIQVMYAKEYLLGVADHWLSLNVSGATPGSLPIFFGGDMNSNVSRTSFTHFGTQTATQSGSDQNNVFTDLNTLSTGDVITANTHHSYATYNADQGIYTTPKISQGLYSNSIDYIFTNASAIETGNYTVERTGAVMDPYTYLYSDHCPIFADLTFSDPALTDPDEDDSTWAYPFDPNLPNGRL